VVEPDTTIGRLAPGLADFLGLPRGVQVLAGTGDGAATYAGSGVDREGLALDLSGTACAFGAYSGRYLPDLEQRLFLNLKSPTAPGWFVIYVNQFGRTHRWFLETFCADLIAEGGVEAAYRALDEAAAVLEPGSGGVLAVPHLSGRASPPRGHTRGAWVGFGLGYTRAHFYRALLESHAVEQRQAKARMQALSPALRLEEVFVSGGGSRSDFWNQLKADVVGSRYRRLVASDLSTLRGDALIAARARGWPALEADVGPAFDREYAPQPAQSERYAQVAGGYEVLTAGLDPVMERLFG
jgi:xylulokinase